MTDQLKRRIDDVNEDLIACKTEVGQQMEAGTKRMGCLSSQIEEVAANVSELRESVESLLEIFETSRRFFIAMGWFGKIVRWLVLTGGGVAIIWYFIKTGDWNGR